MATLKDVAELAGVTVTTVSRVLNNRGYISDKTRQAVYEAMKRLDYRPNELARSLSKRRTNVIGVIVPSVAHPYFCRVVSFLEQEAARQAVAWTELPARQAAKVTSPLMNLTPRVVMALGMPCRRPPARLSPRMWP